MTGLVLLVDWDMHTVWGKLGHSPSKWFGRYKTKLGITDPRKTFHSFRHTLIDDLRDAGVQDSLIKRIVGHEDGAVTFRIYGSRSPLTAMAEALKQITIYKGKIAMQGQNSTAY